MRAPLRRPYFPPLRKGDAKAVLITSVIAAGLSAAMIYYASELHRLQARVNHGFGPEWDCLRPDKGDPICTRAKPHEPAPGTN
jgi:hypothetical protein